MKPQNIIIAITIATLPSIAHAAYDYSITNASSAVIGATCDSSATNPGIIYKCSGKTMSTMPTCAKYQTIPCVLSGNGSGGTTDYRICHYKSLQNKPCDACNYYTTTGSTWQTAGNHVVRKQTTGGTPGTNSCTATSDYIYGCSSGYYQTSISGNSIVCTQCPSLGGITATNSEGTTEITTCYIPENKPGTDSTGTFQYTNRCYYTK